MSVQVSTRSCTAWLHSSGTLQSTVSQHTCSFQEHLAEFNDTAAAAAASLKRGQVFVQVSTRSCTAWLHSSGTLQCTSSQHTCTFKEHLAE